MFEYETEELSVLPMRLETSATATLIQYASITQIAGDDSSQSVDFSQVGIVVAVDNSSTDD